MTHCYVTEMMMDDDDSTCCLKKYLISAMKILIWLLLMWKSASCCCLWKITPCPPKVSHDVPAFAAVKNHWRRDGGRLFSVFSTQDVKVKPFEGRWGQTEVNDLRLLLLRFPLGISGIKQPDGNFSPPPLICFWSGFFLGLRAAAAVKLGLERKERVGLSPPTHVDFV